MVATARPRPTCTRSAACCSRCSPGGPRSRATTGSPSGCAAPTRRHRSSRVRVPDAPRRRRRSSTPCSRPIRPAADRGRGARGARWRAAGDRGGGRARGRGGGALHGGLPRAARDRRARGPDAAPRPQAASGAAGRSVAARASCAAGALAFVGATIANADRVVEVPRVTGLTVPGGARGARRGGTRRPGRGAARRRARAYSESVAAGHVIAQTPLPAERVDRDGARSRRARQPRHGLGRRAGRRRGDAAGGRRGAATHRIRRQHPLRGVVGRPAGRVVSTDVDAGEQARRPGPIGVVVSSGPPGRPFPTCAESRSTTRSHGSTAASRPTSWRRGRRRPSRHGAAPGSRRRDARRARLDRDADGRPSARVGRRPGRRAAAATTTRTRSRSRCPRAGGGSWSTSIPRYLIFGSAPRRSRGRARAPAQIALDEVGSDAVAPLSGAGTYRLHVRPQRQRQLDGARRALG